MRAESPAPPAGSGAAAPASPSSAAAAPKVVVPAEYNAVASAHFSLDDGYSFRDATALASQGTLSPSQEWWEERTLPGELVWFFVVLVFIRMYFCHFYCDYDFYLLISNNAIVIIIA